MGGVGPDELSVRLQGIEILLVVGGLLARSIGVLGTQGEAGLSGGRDSHGGCCQEERDDV